ncbi:SIR2-like domain protein [compost metagenome]
MTRAVVGQLRTPTDADLTNHHIILRLSRNLDNRPVIVTTNFDTMLEAALIQAEGNEQARQLSFSGQDLPSPGSSDFGGIIHLHGRIADKGLDLDQTPFVVTSADYGDAYMRSGWASRFLFDLCRCKTIVLIGYRAGDAPVRYFLNVLEADRQRFPDLHPVYALDSVENRDSPDARWEALAVEPIVYEKVADTSTGKLGHSALWRDLNLLAEVVERPRAIRRMWAEEILVKPFAAVVPSEVDRISWLFSGKQDLISVAADTITDSAWFDFFDERKLFSDQDAASLLAAWCAKDFQSEERIKLALAWRKLGKLFADALAYRLDYAKEISELWLRSWRLLTVYLPFRTRSPFDEIFSVASKLRSNFVLNSDIYNAVDLLTPELRLSYRKKCPENAPQQVSDLIWSEWKVEDSDEAQGLIDVLVDLPQANFIMEIATASLSQFVSKAIDVGAIYGDNDRTDSNVPSVEPHEQNTHRDGAIFLVQLLARLLPAAIQTDRSRARMVVESWRRMPGILGTRLWMHALRMRDLFSADEAIIGLLEIPMNVFWAIRRELALALRDRAGESSPEHVRAIEHRIITEAEIYLQGFDVEEGQAVWRDRARDREVWLHLKMLEKARMLSSVGAAELQSIKERRDYLDSAVEDQDFFSSYSYGVRSVVGNAQPLLDAGDENRLEVAHEFIQSPDIDRQMGWNAYCRSDPIGAIDTLSTAPLDDKNAPLWDTLIGSLAFRDEELTDARRDLFIKVFAMLEPASERFLALIIGRLTALYLAAPRLAVPAIAGWWPRLFAIAVVQEAASRESGHQLYGDAINSPTGRLTEAALIDIDLRRKAGESIEKPLLEAVSRATTASGPQRILALAVLVQNVHFVLAVAEQTVVREIDVALGADDVEGSALRSVLVSLALHSKATSQVFSKHILRGVTEIRGTGGDTAAAAKIIAPALALIRQEPDATSWGISLQDAREVLRKAPPSLRSGAAMVLTQSIGGFEEGPAEAWRSSIGPLIEEIWPRERTLQDKALTPHFADLVIRSAKAFPEALSQMLHYLTRLEGRSGLSSLQNSPAPEQYPRETLALLWHLFGPGSEGSLYNIPKVIARLIQAEPSLERDRRLQWLDQRATR